MRLLPLLALIGLWGCENATAPDDEPILSMGGRWELSAAAPGAQSSCVLRGSGNISGSTVAFEGELSIDGQPTALMGDLETVLVGQEQLDISGRDWGSLHGTWNCGGAVGGWTLLRVELL
jgi:hypothetical protein